MIIVDSCVWIDYFNGTSTPESDRLDELLGAEPILVGDLILAEVLQGFRRDADHRQAADALDAFPIVAVVGADAARRSAANHRSLRARGLTVRTTIDVLIGTYCIDHDHALLTSDRDFDPMAEHLGLRRA